MYLHHIQLHSLKKFSKSSQKILSCYLSYIKNESIFSNKRYNEIGSTWIAKCIGKSPKQCQPYMRLMRLDRPIGTWLLYLPCTWGIALATPLNDFISTHTLALFGMGAILMRGAGCTINDLWDQDFDKQVERTKSRPLACGDISFRNSIIFLGAQMSLALMILLQFNWHSVAIGITSLAGVVSYPLFKRFTYWPQVALGFVFNVGVILGYSAVSGFCNWSIVLPLYISGVCWTVAYDTIYAMQDIEDDKKVGLKSTAILFGDKGKIWMTSFGLGMWSMLLLTGHNYGAGSVFYLGSSLAVAHLAYQIYTLNVKDRSHCLKLFKSNRNTGLIIFLSLFFDRGLSFGLPFL